MGRQRAQLTDTYAATLLVHNPQLDDAETQIKTRKADTGARGAENCIGLRPMLSDSNSKMLRNQARDAVGKIHADFVAQEQQVRANLLVRLKRTSTDQAALAVMMAAAREGLSPHDVMAAAKQHEVAGHDKNFAHRVYGSTLNDYVKNMIWSKGVRTGYRPSSSVAVSTSAWHDTADNVD